MNKPHRILVVHNNIFVRVRVRMLLKGYRVSGAGSGDAVLSVLRMGFFIPDLVIIKHQLPDMSGEKLLADLREAKPTRPFPFFEGPVLLLGVSETNERTSALEKACADQGAVYVPSFSCYSRDLEKLMRVVDGQLDPYGAGTQPLLSVQT